MSSVYVLDSDEFDLDSDSSCSSSSFDGAEGSLLPEVNVHDPFSDPKTRSRLVSSHKIREWIEDITPIEDIPTERRKSLRAELLNNLDTTTDWNIIFQELLDITVQTPHEKQMKIKMINKLSVTFASFAQPHLIEALKKQLRDPSIGGLAGGEKHIIGNLFLKEATNNREVNGKTIYTDNINSAKSAEHELKSLRSIISTGVKNLNFPLMVLVYYLGRCFTCQSLLPINEYSIVFGSDDGSKTFHNRNPEVYELIQATCKSLNLRPRGIKTKDGVFNIACPFDLEAHVSFDDQRSYVLDPARLFPPIPELKAKDDHLCKLFRPEFVRKYRKPLNPDAFSNARWASAEEKQECIDDLREAYAFLLNDVVKGLARNLEERFGFDDDHANRSFDAKQDLLSFEAHSVGLNIRYLGLLRSNIVRSKNLRRYILAELIARAQNRIMRQELFKIDIKSDKQVFRQAALDLMNKLFTSDPQIRKTYWNERLKPTLLSAYEGSLSKEEDLEDFDYSVEIPRRWFWRRTIHHCGTKVDTVSAKAFMLREPLVLEDLQLIFKVKYINIESLANTTEDFSAVEHFNKNLGRRARVLPADSPHVLADVMNLANALVREESKDNEKIMFVLQKMKDSCQSEKLVMKDPYNVARMLSLIADIERDRANFDEASVYIQRSIQIRKQFLKSLDENINSAQHIIVIEALFSQGLIECARQNSKVARDLFSFILASIKNKEVNGFTDFDALQGKCSNMFFRSSLELALLVMEDNNFFLAEKLLTKAHRLLLSTPHPSEIHLSTITNRLAICALLQNRMKEAEKCANESLEIRLEFYGSNNEKFAHALVLISFVYYFYRNFDQAEELLLNSKRIYESCNTPRFFAMVNANLARFYHKKARMEPQMKQQLLEKSKALLLERKDKRYGTISDLAAVYYELGQQQEAIAMVEQAKNVIKNKSKPLGDYFQLIEDALRGNDGDLVFKLTERLTFESATIYIEMVYSRIDEFDTKKELESAKKRIDKSHRKFTNSKKKLSECFLHRSNSMKEGVNSIISKYSDILQSDTFSSPLDILLYDVPKLSIAEDYTRPIYFIKIDDDSSIHGSHSTQFKIGKKLFTPGDVDLSSSTESLTFIDKDELRKELEPYAEIFLLVVGIGFHLSDALKQVYMMTSSKADDSNFIINQPVIVFYWPLSSYMIEWVKSPKLNGFVRKSHIEQYAKTADTIADSLLGSMLMLDSFSKCTNIITYNVGADLLLRAFDIRSKRGISEVPFHGYNKVLMLEPFSQNDLFSRVLQDYEISFEANLTIYKCVQDATLQSALLMAQVDADPILVRVASASPAVSAMIDVERLSINMKDKNNWHLCKHILRDLYCAINGISFKDPRRVYESSSNLVGLIELNRNAHSFGLRSSQH